MNCPYCGSADTLRFYAARMPNILSACPEAMLSRVRSLPLEARLCKACLLGFNSTRLDDAALKEIYDNYLYISPRGGIGRTKYTGMIQTMLATYAPGDHLVEIGCSEGYLLQELRQAGFTNLTGIEPSPQAEQARALGFTIIKSYFDDRSFDEGAVDGFYLMHVFEHFPDPFSVLRAMRRALSPSGAITIEVPNFDGFHHQHLYFYSVPFMARLCRENGLKLISVAAADSILRLVMTHTTDGRAEAVPIPEAEDLVALAEKKYRTFQAEVARLERLASEYEGKTLHWWGAGSSGVVYLNQLAGRSLERVRVEVVDGDRQKWGCIIPGVNLRVQPFEVLRGRSIDCLVVASSFYPEIRQTLQGLNLSVRRTEVFAE